METPNPAGTANAAAAPVTDGRRGRATSASGQGRAARSMGGAVVLLLACLVLAVWVVVDPASRAWQLAALAIVFVLGGVVVAVTLRRHR